MTPTVTQAGETVTVWIGGTFAHLTPDEAAAHADAVRSAAHNARDAKRQRQQSEARAAERVAFLAAHPDAVEAKADVWRSGQITGLGAVVIDGGTIYAATWWPVEHYEPLGVGALTTWHTPIRMRIGNGRAAHTWQGGPETLCKMAVWDPAVPGQKCKPCTRCAAIVAARSDMNQPTEKQT